MPQDLKTRLERIMLEMLDVRASALRHKSISLQSAAEIEFFASDIVKNATRLVGEARTVRAREVERTMGYSANGRAQRTYGASLEKIVLSAVSII
jgi:hypothetical protein